MSCVICLDSVADSWRLVQFGCCSSGIFCKECLSNYLDSGKDKCPTCGEKFTININSRPESLITNSQLDDYLESSDSDEGGIYDSLDKAQFRSMADSLNRHWVNNDLLDFIDKIVDNNVYMDRKVDGLRKELNNSRDYINTQHQNIMNLSSRLDQNQESLTKFMSSIPHVIGNLKSSLERQGRDTHYLSPVLKHARDGNSYQTMVNLLGALEILINR